MYELNKEFLRQAKSLLLEEREQTLNGLSHFNSTLKFHAKDDQAAEVQGLQTEAIQVARGSALSLRLRDIDRALDRIEKGEYGICEETEEPIEKERLLAIPWTSLSLSGAEIREKNRSRKS
jgi:DnaK suppressor protein